MAFLDVDLRVDSQVLAIGLSWLKYVFIRRVKDTNSFLGNTDKELSLSGYSSGITLLLFSSVIMSEASHVLGELS